MKPSLTQRNRNRVLNAWRGPSHTHDEAAYRTPAKLASAFLPNVLRGLRIETRQAEGQILTLWGKLIDPEICKHAKPTGINAGTLFVTVDSSVWLDEIVRYRRREILQRLQSALGTEMVKKISFRVG